MYSEVITGFLPGLGNILRCKKLLIGVQKISDTVKKSISKYDPDLDPFFRRIRIRFFHTGSAADPMLLFSLVAAPDQSDTSVIIWDFWTVTFEHTNLRFPA